jgi:hypothetical protein
MTAPNEPKGRTVDHDLGSHDGSTATAEPAQRRTTGFFLIGLAVALLLAGIVSYYASSEPDGLEKVAADHSLDAGARPSGTADGPLADYAVAGVGNERLSVGLAGVIGVGSTLLVAGGLFLVLRRREPTASE